MLASCVNEIRWISGRLVRRQGPRWLHNLGGVQLACCGVGCADGFSGENAGGGLRFTECQEAATCVLDGLAVILLFPDRLGPEIDLKEPGEARCFQRRNDVLQRSESGTNHAVVVFRPVVLPSGVIQLDTGDAVGDFRQSFEKLRSRAELARAEPKFDRGMVALVQQVESFISLSEE